MGNKFEVKLNDGVIKNVIIEDYDARKIADELNNPDHNMIALGNVVVQRYSVIRITPIDEIEEEKEESDIE